MARFKGPPGRRTYSRGDSVSIVRVGLAETKNFAEGYDAIFGTKKSAAPKKGKPSRTAKPAKANAKGKGVKAKRKPAKRK